MNGKKVPFTILILAIWAGIIIIAVALCFVTWTDDVSPYYDEMTEAANIADRAMEEIRKYKTERGMEIYDYDKLGTGMIGDKDYTAITTTEGVLEAKRTSCNPNWAAVIVSMFIRAGLRKGDQVCMVFSGSFPAMNICALAAAQAYGADVCVMAGIGASNYGANNPDFTFFDMAEYLCDIGVLNHRIDYVSLGGDGDTGKSFPDPTVKDAIVARIKASSSTYVYEEDFQANISKRLEYMHKDVPNMKFLLNVGGSSVGLGTGVDAFIGSGYYEPSKLAHGGKLEQSKKTDGLLQVALSGGIPVASMLNIKGLAEKYGIPYDPDEKAVIGAESGCNAYFSRSYDLTVPIIALCISAAVFIFYYVYRVKSGAAGRKDERNRILYRR